MKDHFKRKIKSFYWMMETRTRPLYGTQMPFKCYTISEFAKGNDVIAKTKTDKFYVVHLCQGLMVHGNKRDCLLHLSTWWLEKTDNKSKKVVNANFS